MKKIYVLEKKLTQTVPTSLSEFSVPFTMIKRIKLYKDCVKYIMLPVLTSVKRLKCDLVIV